jgi:hypothetical protein
MVPQNHREAGGSVFDSRRGLLTTVVGQTNTEKGEGGNRDSWIFESRRQVQTEPISTLWSQKRVLIRVPIRVPIRGNTRQHYPVAIAILADASQPTTSLDEFRRH